ncbi:hypothetical protein VMCG_07022 [Cytospora schulzeri]|uniref:Uncharacterized protein n=1 Tax=Cytospora schulzeri TaxID=448051 RepID=A0A423W3V6_9PEZI|nr:hypothetical protein VMCG_07022 [Valsa malicola]
MMNRTVAKRKTKAAAHVNRVPNPDACLLRMPVEVRSKIFEYVFADLIAQLPEDSMFAVLAMYDHTYDITATLKQKCTWRGGRPCPRMQFHPMCPGHRAELRLSDPVFWADYGLRRLLDYIGEHPEQIPSRFAMYSGEPGQRLLYRSGMTSLLLVNRRMYNEALGALCAQTEFVVHVTGRSSPTHASAVLFHDGCPHLALARRMTVNVHAPSKMTIDKIIWRLGTLLAAIAAGGRLSFLRLFFKGTPSVDQQSMEHLMKLLEGHLGEILKQRHCSVEVYLGDISRELVKSERVSAFAKALQGDYIGRDFNNPKPHIGDNFGAHFASWIPSYLGLARVARAQGDIGQL